MKTYLWIKLLIEIIEFIFTQLLEKKEGFIEMLGSRHLNISLEEMGEWKHVRFATFPLLNANWTLSKLSLINTSTTFPLPRQTMAQHRISLNFDHYTTTEIFWKITWEMTLSLNFRILGHKSFSEKVVTQFNFLNFDFEKIFHRSHAFSVKKSHVHQ